MSSIEWVPIDSAIVCNQPFGILGCVCSFGAVDSPLAGIQVGTFPYLKNSLLGREGKR